MTDDYVVGATTDIEDAAAFYISQPEAEGDEPVLISYYKKAVIGEHAAKLKVHKIARYLQVHGINWSQCWLSCSAVQRQERVTLSVCVHDRFKKKPVSGDMEEALANNNEGYYIKCCSGVSDNFLAVIKQPGQDPLYKTACRSYQSSFDNENVLMLFQIIRPTQSQFTETSSEQVKGIITQLKKYEVPSLQAMEFQN